MKKNKKKIIITIIVTIIVLIPFYLILQSINIKNTFSDNGFEAVNVGKTSIVSYYEKESKNDFDNTNYNLGFHVSKVSFLNPFKYVASVNIYNQEDSFENYNLFVEYTRNEITYYSFSIQNGNDVSDTCPIDIDTMEYDQMDSNYMESCSTEEYQTSLNENKDFLTWGFEMIEDELSFLNNN